MGICLPGRGSPADFTVTRSTSLALYARYQANSKEHAWLCGVLFPNDLGLFDTLGNVYEWCQESMNASKSLKKGIYNDYTIYSNLLEKNTLVSCEGFVLQATGGRPLGGA